MAARSSERVRFSTIVSDPTGELFGDLPTYHWTLAPEGLATRRQLAARGLRKGGQSPVAVLVGRGWLIAYLYRVDLAKPKFALSPAKLAAVWTAARSRQRCTSCERTGLGYIPRQGAPAFGRCWTCMGYPEPEPDGPGGLVCPGCDGAEQVPCPGSCQGARGDRQCLTCDGRGVIDCVLCQGL